MALELNGTTGVSAVQAGAVESGDLPAGSVIQVVSATKTDGVVSANTTTETLIFDASITPTNASNKILVLVTYNVYLNSTGAVRCITKLKRNSNLLMNSNTQRASGGEYKSFGAQFSYLDSPVTTSEITYGLFCENSDVSGGTSDFNRENNEITITLMEIAG